MRGTLTRSLWLKKRRIQRLSERAPFLLHGQDFLRVPLSLVLEQRYRIFQH
ncbi:hypothetical protein EBME_0922 [bacterium endosymbiont of Mortierella elongata FMR23-6]|nr:hypothetical protein EBME_0922 [bacterium endosymbiont of Mortierella elongata FMR23-6]